MRAVNFADHEKIPATAGSRGRISPGGYGLRYCRPAMLVLLAVVLLLAAPKAGAAGPGVISGRLLTTAGEPVAADTVVLFFNVKNGPPPAPPWPRPLISRPDKEPPATTGKTPTRTASCR